MVGFGLSTIDSLPQLGRWNHVGSFNFVQDFPELSRTAVVDSFSRSGSICIHLAESNLRV